MPWYGYGMAGTITIWTLALGSPYPDFGSSFDLPPLILKNPPPQSLIRSLNIRQMLIHYFALISFLFAACSVALPVADAALEARIPPPPSWRRGPPDWKRDPAGPPPPDWKRDPELSAAELKREPGAPDWRREAGVGAPDWRREPGAPDWKRKAGVGAPDW
ncbi:hypothetical protein HGRIS_007503 [Hohenbuehelia grisea]|uniref:Uncharacterized protein n=1 Tax=Hohenbuehelia grisea TaxID=104357 RepID=A0ABR3J575_9AGAR